MDLACIAWISLSADWCSIVVDLVIGCGVAYILSVVIPKKMQNDRSLKDFFMTEFQNIRNEYNDFCKAICMGEVGATKIKETFKQLSMKLDDLQDVANQNLEVNLNLTSELNQTQLRLTGSDEINDQYENETVVFNQRTILDLCQQQDVFNRNVISAIASINRANSKR